MASTSSIVAERTTKVVGDELKRSAAGMLVLWSDSG